MFSWKLLLIFVTLYSNKIDGIQQQFSKHPNVLLFIIDDLRPMIGCYNDLNAITPNIDELCFNGVSFSNAYAQQSLCGPSRTSFLTSRRPDSTKSIDVHYYWRHHSGNFTSLPQYFKENGYETQSIGKVFHPGTTSNYDDAKYSWTQVPYHPSTQKYKNEPVCKTKFDKLKSNIFCPVNVTEQPKGTLPDIQSTMFALEWLNKRSRNLHRQHQKPFFLAIGFHKPHIPLKFPQEFLALHPLKNILLPPNRIKAKGLPSVAWNPWNDFRSRDDIAQLNLSFPFGRINDDYSRVLRQGYYAATTYVDSLIGLILNQIRKSFPDTIIALISDHGVSLGENQEWSKFSNSEVTTRVPFIVTMPPNLQNESWSPKSSPICQKVNINKYFKRFINENKKYNAAKRNINYNHKIYDGNVELIDLFPTLVDLAGIKHLPSCIWNTSALACTEGVSLSCVIKSFLDSNTNKASSCPHKIASLSQYPRPSLCPSVHPDSDQCKLTEAKIMGYSLRNDRFRYTTWLSFNNTNFQSNWDKPLAEELYDHKYDPAETINIVRKKPKTLRKLKKYIQYFGCSNIN